MTRNLLLTLAVTASLAVPAVADAAAPADAGADAVFISFGVLRDWTGAAQVDTITIADGGARHPGRLLVRDATTPLAEPSGGCVDAAADGISCDATVWSVNVLTGDLDDAITVDVALAGWLDGGPGADAIRGGPAGDTVIGADGNDVLDGRGGADAVYGDAGDDTVEAVDGRADTIDCGEGNDLAVVDPTDTTTNCEQTALTIGTAPTDPVTEPGSGESTPAPAGDTKVKDETRSEPAPKADPAPSEEPLTPLPLTVPEPVGLTSDVALVSADGRAALDLACAPTEAGGCRGDVFLDPAPVGRSAKRGKGGKGGKRPKVTAYLARRGRYGKKPFVIAAGRRAKLQVKLTPAARRALGLKAGKRARAARRGRRVRAKVTVVQKGKKAASRSVIELRS